MNRKDVQGGFTPLHLAADAGQCEAVETLLRMGAQLDPRSAQGWTPLGLATLKVIRLTCHQEAWQQILLWKWLLPRPLCMLPCDALLVSAWVRVS